MMMTTAHAMLAFAAALLVACTSQAFLLPVGVSQSSRASRSGTVAWASASTSTSSSSNKAVLNQRMPWELSVVVKSPVEGLPDVTTDLKLRFVEEPGYEPPQGKIFVERDPLALIATDDKGFALVGSPAWTLSEDKDDRKWGLWIWGLFEEPLYPFLYFSLPMLDECLTEVVGEDGSAKKELRPLFGGAGIPGKRLYFRFAHSREDGASVLSDAKVWYKEVEMQKVDFLGIGGEANVGETKDAGEAQLRPVFM